MTHFYQIKFMLLFILGVHSLVAATSWAQPLSAKAAFEDLLFSPRKGIHTDAFIIIKDNKKLYERYANHYHAQDKHLSWSMGKSIAGIIAAMAIDEGKFSMTDRVSRWIPKYQGSATVLDLFQMSSGIKFREEYSGIPIQSDVTRMLYLDGLKAGFADYTVSLPLREDASPGDHFYYSSGDANLIMEIMKRSFHDQNAYDQFPWKALFEPLQIQDATFEQDKMHAFVGSSYFYMTADEYARIGQLLMQKGQWNGKQLIPAWYFELMNQVAEGVNARALPGTSPTRAYSAQITTNLPIRLRGFSSEYPNLPEDSLLMIGHQGQLVIASPSEKLVIVRLATDHGDDFNPDRQKLFQAMRKFLADEKQVNYHGAGDLPGVPTPLGKVVLPEIPESKITFQEYLKVPNLLRALYAKEFCSCFFVLKRSRQICDADLKETLPVLPFVSINEEQGEVTASLDGIHKSRAIDKGETLGCTLIK